MCSSDSPNSPLKRQTRSIAMESAKDMYQVEE